MGAIEATHSASVRSNASSTMRDIINGPMRPVIAACAALCIFALLWDFDSSAPLVREDAVQSTLQPEEEFTESVESLSSLEARLDKTRSAGATTMNKAMSALQQAAQLHPPTHESEDSLLRSIKAAKKKAAAVASAATAAAKKVLNQKH